MKNKKLYQILPMIMVGICVAGMCVVGVRIFAKKVLIGKLGIENYITCTLADYNWGDRLERTLPAEQNLQIEKSEQLLRLEGILGGAPQQEVTENTSTGAGEQPTLLERFSENVFAAEHNIETYCNEKFLLYRQMRGISASFDDVMNWELAYARKMGSTYTLSSGYDYQAVEETELTAYAENIIAQKEIAEDAGVEFLYVQYPYRVDEENSQVPWGASSYENANVDRMLSQLSDASVEVLDLRKALVETGWDYDSGFYDTDGHWTTRSGFLSAGIVADYLNANYGFAYDEMYFDETSYDVRSYSVNSYMVDEEVELFLPNFDTKMSVMDAYREVEYQGTFEEACFDMTKADTIEYSSVLTAYSASRIRNSYLFEYHNEMAVNNQKRILITSDSFSWHLIPYLAIDTEYVDYVYKMTPEQMDYYIDELKPDMVIVMDKPYY